MSVIVVLKKYLPTKGNRQITKDNFIVNTCLVNFMIFFSDTFSFYDTVIVIPVSSLLLFSSII